MKDFRVIIHLADGELETREFLINIPFVPRKDDLISIEDMVEDFQLTDDDFFEIENLSWSVWFVSWNKDKDGFYAKVFCTGQE